MSRIGELIHMNPRMTQDENARKTIGKRTVLMVLGALLFTLPLHGQQTASDASDAAVMEGPRSDQPIPPAVMKELEAMKKRIEQLEAQLQKRDGQGPLSRCLLRATLCRSTAGRERGRCAHKKTKGRAFLGLGLDLAQRQPAQQGCRL